jgi:putative addiction module component (TIGR02574 family)
MTVELKVPLGFDEASTERRIEFVQDLWDRISQDPTKVSVPIEHEHILKERLQEYQSRATLGQPWNEVRDQLLKKLNQN